MSKRTTLRRRWGSLAVVFAAFGFAAACNTVVESAGTPLTSTSGAGGGAGGEGAVATATTSATGGTSVSAGTGGAGGMGGHGGGGAATGVTAAVIGASAGTGADCYGPYECGDPGKGCVGCAYWAGCGDAFQACLADPLCGSFGDCMDACADAAADCEVSCAAAVPGGYAPYAALAECVLCQACGTVCAGQTDWACR